MRRGGIDINNLFKPLITDLQELKRLLPFWHCVKLKPTVCIGPHISLKSLNLDSNATKASMTPFFSNFSFQRLRCVRSTLDILEIAEQASYYSKYEHQ